MKQEAGYGGQVVSAKENRDGYGLVIFVSLEWG